MADVSGYCKVSSARFKRCPAVGSYDNIGVALDTSLWFCLLIHCRGPTLFSSTSMWSVECERRWTTGRSSWSSGALILLGKTSRRPVVLQASWQSFSLFQSPSLGWTRLQFSFGYSMTTHLLILSSLSSHFLDIMFFKWANRSVVVFDGGILYSIFHHLHSPRQPLLLSTRHTNISNLWYGHLKN